MTESENELAKGATTEDAASGSEVEGGSTCAHGGPPENESIGLVKQNSAEKRS